MIPFTRRELQNAWRGALAASRVPQRTNPHRLLLFYAVECGLKSVYLKQQNANTIDGDIADKLKHDLNRIMALLCVGKEYLLPVGLSLPAINHTKKPRPCDAGSLNQVWRYGGSLINGADIQIEQQLEKINQWIAKEIK
jgi:hypothetical protein